MGRSKLKSTFKASASVMVANCEDKKKQLEDAVRYAEEHKCRGYNIVKLKLFPATKDGRKINRILDGATVGTDKDSDTSDGSATAISLQDESEMDTDDIIEDVVINSTKHAKEYMQAIGKKLDPDILEESKKEDISKLNTKQAKEHVQAWTLLSLKRTSKGSSLQ